MKDGEETPESSKKAPAFEVPNPSATSDLMSRLQAFLPQMERANEGMYKRSLDSPRSFQEHRVGRRSQANLTELVLGSSNEWTDWMVWLV